jgi:hypothetical protein
MILSLARREGEARLCFSVLGSLLSHVLHGVLCVRAELTLRQQSHLSLPFQTHRGTRIFHIFHYEYVSRSMGVARKRLPLQPLYLQYYFIEYALAHSV